MGEVAEKLDKVIASLASLDSRIQSLETRSSSASQESADSPNVHATGEPTVAELSENLHATQGHVNAIPGQSSGGRGPAESGTATGVRREIQEEYLIIRDSLQGLRLPPDQKLNEIRTGIARASQPGYNVISKCGRYIETALKWLGTQRPHQSTSEDLVTLHTILLATLRYLQGEYQALLVNSQFDSSTAQIYRVFQSGENAGFDDTARSNLRAAVEISGLRGRSQDNSARRGGYHGYANRGRGYRGGRNYNNFGNRDQFHQYAQRFVNPNRYPNSPHHDDVQ